MASSSALVKRRCFSLVKTTSFAYKLKRRHFDLDQKRRRFERHIYSYFVETLEFKISNHSTHTHSTGRPTAPSPTLPKRPKLETLGPSPIGRSPIALPASARSAESVSEWLSLSHRVSLWVSPRESQSSPTSQSLSPSHRVTIPLSHSRVVVFGVPCSGGPQPKRAKPINEKP